jgi:hypothetical protein
MDSSFCCILPQTKSAQVSAAGMLHVLALKTGSPWPEDLNSIKFSVIIIECGEEVCYVSLQMGIGFFK